MEHLPMSIPDPNVIGISSDVEMTGELIPGRDDAARVGRVER
jgi:hypothetical protein